MDHIIDQVSGNKRYVMILLTMTMCIQIPGSMNAIASVFTAQIPDFRCFISYIDDTSNNLTNSEIKENFIPYKPSTEKYDTCYYKIYDLKSCKNSSNYDECVIKVTNSSTFTISSCNQGYVYNFNKPTIVSEWDLICSNESYLSLSISIYYLGIFLGALIGGVISDCFGRVITYRFGSILGAIFGFSASFSKNILVFSILRFFQITCFYQAALASIVYGVEISPKTWRSLSGQLWNVIFGLGCVMLSLIAYLCDGWKMIQISISLLFLISFVTSFLIPESPRWLYSKKKFDEAHRNLEKMAARNGTSFNRLVIEDQLKTSSKQASTIENTSTLKELFSRKYSRTLLLCNMFVWMVTSMVYYGLILNSGNLGWNIYLSNAIGGVMEMLASSVSIVVAYKTGCRKFIVCNLLLSSITCLSSTVINHFGQSNPAAQTVGIVMAMIGRFSASAVFGILFLQTMELFPTCGRATALGVSSMAARIGSIISPWTVQAQRNIPWLTPAIFGVSTLVAAGMTWSYPTTHKKQLLMTFTEAEEFYEKHFRRNRSSSHTSSQSKKNSSDEELQQLN